MPRERVRGRNKSFVDDAIMISERPPAVRDGHYKSRQGIAASSAVAEQLGERKSAPFIVVFAVRDSFFPQLRFADAAAHVDEGKRRENADREHPAPGVGAERLNEEPE